MSPKGNVCTNKSGVNLFAEIISYSNASPTSLPEWSIFEKILMWITSLFTLYIGRIIAITLTVAKCTWSHPKNSSVNKEYFLSAKLA